MPDVMVGRSNVHGTFSEVWVRENPDQSWRVAVEGRVAANVIVRVIPIDPADRALFTEETIDVAPNTSLTNRNLHPAFRQRQVVVDGNTGDALSVHVQWNKVNASRR